MKTAKTAIYARKSREFKNQENISIPQQVDDGRRAAGENVPDEHVYIDVDLTGELPPRQFLEDGHRNRKIRPDLTRLLEDVEAGKVNRIICRKRDRLFRKTLLALRFYDFLQLHNCALVCTHETLPASTDASGKFTLTVLAAAAELELNKTKENIKAAKDYSKRQGRKMGPVWTAGYKDGRTSGTVEVDEKGANMVREVFDLALTGKPVLDLCRHLNDHWRHLCRPHHVGKSTATWHPWSVYKMLANRRYVGLNPDGSTSALYKPIVKPEVFWRVQELLRARRGTITSGKRIVYERPLAGLLRCVECGKALCTVPLSRKHPDVRLYACVHTELPHKTRPFSMMESKWIDFLRFYFVKDDGRVRSVDTDEVETLRARIADSEQRSRELARLQSRRELSVSDYALAAREEQSARNKLKAKLANLTAAAVSPPSTNGKRVRGWGRCARHRPGAWSSLKEHEKKVRVRRCIEWIDVAHDHAVIHPVGEAPLVAPLMKERVRGSRAGNCLYNSAADVFECFKARNDGRFDWSKMVNADFYPAAERVKRLVSLKARARHGLKGGLTYGGRRATSKP